MTGSNGNGLVAKRREAVGEMIAAGVTNRQRIANELATRGFKNPSTGKAYTESTIRNDLRIIKAEPVEEMIGRQGPLVTNYGPTRHSVDWTKTDYEFWDRFRRGKAKTYEIGGLLGAPAARILTAFVMGGGFQFETDSETVSMALQKEFLDKNEVLLQDAVYDHYTLGDAYLVGNPDGTLAPLSPELVEKKVNPFNLEQVEEYIIKGMVKGAASGPTITVEDHYTQSGRTMIVRMPGQSAPLIESFANFVFPLIPVVHFAFGKSANEIYGHPVYEALLTLFGEYDDVIRKSLDGVKMMGNPKPVVENADNPDAEIDNLKTEIDEYTDESGNLQQRPVIDLASLEMLVLGKGTRFHYAQPSAFTSDTGKMLEYLFLLMLQHIMIPEWVWGGAIASSKASVDSQRPAFIATIEWLQKRLSGPLAEIARVWLAYRGLVEPGLAYSGPLRVKWDPLTEEDMEIRLKYITEAHTRGLMTDVTTLDEMKLVEDPASEVRAAQSEREEKQKRFEQMSMGFEPGEDGDQEDEEEDGQGDEDRD